MIRATRLVALTSLSAGLLLPSLATAATWEVIERQSNGVVREIDRDSIVKAGQLVKVWVRTDYSQKTKSEAELANEAREKELAERGILACKGVVSPFCQPGQDAVAFDKDYLAFNCANRQFAVIAAISYRKDGSVIKPADWSKEKPSMTMVIPDSIGENLLTKICR